MNKTSKSLYEVTLGIIEEDGKRYGNHHRVRLVALDAESAIEALREEGVIDVDPNHGLEVFVEEVELVSRIDYI